MEKDKNDLPKRLRQAAVMSMMPFMMVGGVLIGYFLGDWLDKKFGWDLYAKAVLMVLGFIAGVKESIRMIRETSDNS